MEKTARELQLSGELYDVFDAEMIAIRDKAYDIVSKLSRVNILDKEIAFDLEKQLLGGIGEGSYIVPPFRADYGINIYIGKNTHIDYNCCFLDAGIINIGDDVFIGANCSIFTPCHPIHWQLRWDSITEYALPVTVGSHTWIGGDVVIAPGVIIGEGCVIGAGSVVTKDIPANSLAVGNPCRVVRTLSKKDKSAMDAITLQDASKDEAYKQANGYLYNMEDESLRTALYETLHSVDRLNKISNSEIQLRRDFIRTFVPDFGEGAVINAPFYLTYGKDHLQIGKNSYLNYDCIIFSEAKVTIGDNVLIGPKVNMYTSNYALLPSERKQKLAYAKPITVADNVWIGGSATILGGVTIGKNSVIGAGSVVVDDIPENSIAVGNPARVLRKITDADIEKYRQAFKELPNLTEKDKMVQGYWYNAMDISMVKLRQENNKKTEAFSRITSSTIAYKDRMAKAIVNSYGDNANLLPPFVCDYGSNMHIGEASVVNHSGVFIDTSKIDIGKHALIGPKAGLYCAVHPYDIEARNAGMECAKPITIGDGAWLGGRVTVVPGVTIGKHSVIGTGSVVTRDIPDDVVAVGNPCRVIRKITEDDRINPVRKHRKQILPHKD